MVDIVLISGETLVVLVNVLFWGIPANTVRIYLYTIFFVIFLNFYLIPDYTAATFGYENITDSLVTVAVADTARRAVRNIVDISMFIKTRQARGQIFYLGSVLGSLNEETYIAAQLEGGELLMRVHFNGTTEAYTVGGVKLNNGYNHLIQV